MKRDEVRGIVEGITDEQLDALMNLAGSDLNAEKAKSKQLQKALDEAKEANAALKEESEAKARETMTAEEKMNAFMEEYAKKEKALSIERNTLEAQRVFAGIGLTEDEYAPLMATVVVPDAEATKTNATAIAALVSAQRTNAEQAAKKTALQNTPKPQGGAGTPATVTKEQFDSMSYSELCALYDESPDTYKELRNS